MLQGTKSLGYWAYFTNIFNKYEAGKLKNKAGQASVFKNLKSTIKYCITDSYIFYFN